MEQVASSVAVSIESLRQILLLVEADRFGDDAVKAVTQLLDWLLARPQIAVEILRVENLEGLFGTKFRELPTDAQKVQEALPIVMALMSVWMSGAPIWSLSVFLCAGHNRR